ncbi:Pr6Pr family membrane protein [Kitasatospora atroaurantiaca]|uniref:Pr6Pr family membrane protein n=1 Tax=Kitasatospora atroaurantiaca TaxID=285545 RepID=UPI001BA5C9E8|nr:Pr6Pr family membrane protein [Kitasatospora atroaurantiaca]
MNVLRLVFGLLAAVALGIQGYHVSTQGASMSNFFSYFTILSNMAGVVVLLTGGVLGLLGRPGVPDGVRGAVVLYMTITGLVYAVLLSGYHLPLEIIWVNTVVHKIMPLVYLVDWLAAPPRRRIAYRTALTWLAFPFLYLAYSLIRGPIVHWYAYPFLDPARSGGYGRIAGACTLMTVAFVLVAAALVRAGNALRRRQERAAPAARAEVSQP